MLARFSLSLLVGSDACVFLTEKDTSLNDSITRAADVMIVGRHTSVCRYNVVLMLVCCLLE